MHEKNDRFARFLKKRYPDKEVITLDQHRDCTFIVENDQFVGDFYLIEPNSYKTYHLYAFGENEHEHERISCTRVQYASREDSDKVLRFFFKDERKKQIRVIANYLAFPQSFLVQISQHVKLLPDLETVFKVAKPVPEPDKYYKLESKPRSSSVNVVPSYPMHSDYIDSRNHTEFNAPYMGVNETKKHRKTSYVDNGNGSAHIVTDGYNFDTGKQRKTSYGENGYGNGSTLIAPDVNQFDTEKHRTTNYINNGNDGSPIARDADETETRKPTSTSSSGSNGPTILQRIKVSLDPVASFFGSSFTKSDPKISPHISGGSFGKENKKSKRAEDSDDDYRRDYYQNELVRESFEKVGQGGQSHVVTAKIKDTGKQVAVKYSSFVSKLRGHCAKELSLLKELRHENIVAYYGVLYESAHFHNDPLGFVMEYMEGGSLHGVIYKTTSAFYNGYNVLHWIRQAAAGLIFLHKKKIIHRDIKPANLLLDRDFKQLKICDLGISTTDPTSGTECGTIYYTPPEVFAEKKGEKFSTKCDIYSLGITLWEVCHRKPPYEKEVLLNLLIAIRDRKLRPAIDDDVCPREFADLIKIMWDSEVAKRPDAERVRDEIDRIANKYPKHS
ncbi:unnamed protein product [Auanema sp. JU1783]|nr:unnamed protein product [Auanema sp. JU1783]